MKRKPFAGIYRCRICRQEGARYFFDSQPTETKCGRCDGMPKLVREIAARRGIQAQKSTVELNRGGGETGVGRMRLRTRTALLPQRSPMLASTSAPRKASICHL